MKDLLQQRLDPPVFALLRRVGELAAEEGVGVFLVGGPVRDLLRGAKVLDLDVAVEGDGIVFARALAQRLGGEVKGHLRFGTAVLVLRPEWGPPGTPTAAFAAPVKLDVASARRESYRRPGALPTVAPGTSYDDLYRRDFTVNAMAVRLDPPAFGELLDPFGGRRDLAARLLRVLHEGSFRDDPTRLFRAVRFEQRLGFALEPGTGRLLGEAVAARALDTVTGERIRNELFLLLSEKNPLPGLRRLRQLSLFRAVHPGFAVEEAAIARVGALGERLGTDRRGRLARLLALFSDLDLGAARAVAARLALSGPFARCLADHAEARERTLPRLASAEPLAASALRRLLSRHEPVSLEVLAARGDSGVATGRIHEYLDRLRGVRTRVSGRDLAALGLSPGPRYREVLERLLAARLDGEVATREEELALARRLVGDAAWAP